MEAIPLIGAGLGLFGAASGNQGLAGGGSQSSRPTDQTFPWFRNLGQTVSGSLGSFIGGGANPASIYSGPLTAGLGNAEAHTLDFANQVALNPARLAAQNALIGGQFLPGQGQANPWTDPLIRMAQQPTAEALKHSLERVIPGQAAVAGQQSSSRIGGGSTAKDLQQIRAGEIGARALGDIATGISNNAWNTGFQGMLQGIQLQQQDVQALAQNLAMQGLPRAIQEQGIARAIGLGQQAQQNWLQGLNIAQGLPLQATGNIQQSTSSPGLNQTLFGNQGVFGGLNAALAPTLAQGGKQVANPTIWNSGYNPFTSLFG